MVRGTRIISLGDAAIFNDVTFHLTKVAEHFRYQPVIFPAIWEQETFVKKAGEEILGQMYTFKDKGDRDLCLIPEVTAIVQEQYNESWSKSWKKPVRIFYNQRCYRYERPQEGRYREFNQFGIELLGAPQDSDRYEVMAVLRGMVSAFLPENSYTITESVKRGLSYYVEDGFEVEVPILGAQKQIAGGGRYKEGIGFAIGIDRLMLAIQKTKAKE